MLIDNHDFAIDVSAPDHAVVSGVLRLPSPAAYEERLQPIREALQNANGAYTIDISGVQFLNSSGITGLSRLVLLARSKKTPLVLVGSNKISWQAKTLRPISRLYDKVDVQMV